MSRCNPTVRPGLSIPELIKIVKHSFRERDFDDVQKILMDREAKLKLEIENLQTDYNSAKDGARLLDKNLNLAELQKLSLEEKLRMSRTKCTVLKDTVAKLGQEIEVLKLEKEELRRQNVEATDTLDELIRKKIDSDREVECYKIKIPILESRIMKVEGAFANMFNVKVEDLAPLANSIDKSEGGKIDIDSGDRNSNRSSTKEDGANAALTSPGALSGGSPRVEPQVSVQERHRLETLLRYVISKIK